MPRLILTFELFRSQHNTRRPHARFTHTMTEPHHALTVDGEGEDSGGNEVHEIYVRLGAAPATALNEKDTRVTPTLDGRKCSVRRNDVF